MRTLTANQTLLYSLDSRKVDMRVRIEDGDATLQDMTTFLGFNWVVSAEWDENIDYDVAQATIVLWRNREKDDNGGSQAYDTLSPLHQTSRANLNAAGSYDRLLELTRTVVIDVAVVAEDYAVGGSDWIEMFRGQIDTIEWSDDEIEITCRDQGATLQDTWIEDSADYGDPNGTVLVEDAMQDILDDTMGGGAPTIYVPASPAWAVTAFSSEQQSLQDQLAVLSSMIGWRIAYKWDSGTSAFRYTFYEINRSNTTPDHTFGASQYWSVDTASIDIANIRNACYVKYVVGNAASFLTTGFQSATDASSIANYGRRWMMITLDSSSTIDSSTEALALAEAVVSDLGSPEMEYTVSMPFFHAVELGDLYTFTANNVHMTADTDLAVVSLKHKITADEASTTITSRGSVPQGSYVRWFDNFVSTSGNDSGINVGPGVSTPTAVDQGGSTHVAIDTLRDDKDLAEVEFHIGTSSGFTPDTTDPSTTLYYRGTSRFINIVADEDKIPIDTTVYVKAIGVNSQGDRGTASSAVAVKAKRLGSQYISTETRTGTFMHGAFTQQSRGTSYPPDGWSVTNTWGTDAKVDDGTTYSGHAPKTGKYGLLFTGNTSGTTATSDAYPVTAGRSFNFASEIKADNTSDTATFSVVWLNKAKATVSTEQIFSSTVTASDTWEPIKASLTPPDGAKYAKFTIVQTGTTGNLLVDRIDFNEAQPVGAESRSNQVVIDEDWFGDQGSEPWGRYGWSEWTTNGTTTIDKAVASGSGRPAWAEVGVVNIDGDRTSGSGGGGLVLGDGTDSTTGDFYGRGPIGAKMMWKVRLAGASQTNMAAFMGMWDRATTYPDSGLSNTIHGVGIICRQGGGGGANWLGISRQGTTETTVDLGVTADANWRMLGFRRTPTGYQFMVGDEDVGSEVTTNLPSDSNRYNPMIGVVENAGATRTVRCDKVTLTTYNKRY